MENWKINKTEKQAPLKTIKCLAKIMANLLDMMAVFRFNYSLRLCMSCGLFQT